MSTFRCEADLRSFPCAFVCCVRCDPCTSNLQCALGSYTYYDKFTFMVLVPISIVVLVLATAGGLIGLGRYNDAASREELWSRVTSAIAFMVFLVSYP